jgi:hypothetical protein
MRYKRKRAKTRRRERDENMAQSVCKKHTAVARPVHVQVRVHATAYFLQSLLLPPNIYNWSLWIAIAWSEYFCIHMRLCMCMSFVSSRHPHPHGRLLRARRCFAPRSCRCDPRARFARGNQRAQRVHPQGRQRTSS